MDWINLTAGIGWALASVGAFSHGHTLRRLAKRTQELADSQDALVEAHGHIVEYGETFRMLKAAAQETSLIQNRTWDYVQVLQDILNQHRAYYPKFSPAPLSSFPASEALLKLKTGAPANDAPPPSPPRER